MRGRSQTIFFLCGYVDGREGSWRVRVWGWWRIFILFSGTGSGFCPRFTGAELGLWEFSHHCQSHYKSLQWWENSRRSSSASVNLEQNPDPVPEKSINILHQPHTLTLQEPSLPPTYPNQQSLQFWHLSSLLWDKSKQIYFNFYFLSLHTLFKFFIFTSTPNKTHPKKSVNISPNFLIWSFTMSQENQSHPTLPTERKETKKFIEQFYKQPDIGLKQSTKST